MKFRALLSSVLLGALPIVCGADDPDAARRNRISAAGTDGFRALLAQAGWSPVGSVDEFRQIISTPVEVRRCLLVWFRGADQAGEPLPDGLNLFDFDWRTDFVAKGGSLWLATDQPLPDQLQQALAVDVAETVILARRNAPRYLNRLEFPYAHGVPDSVPNLFKSRNHLDADDRPLMVATNRPSYVRIASNWTTLGVFRRGEWRYPNNLSEIRDLPFVVALTDPSGGKILLQADHSVFINGMLLPKAANDNLAFALNCLDWLAPPPDGPKRYVLFIEDGHVWQPEDYDLMFRAMPTPTAESITQFLWDNRHLLWENLDLAEDVLARLEKDRVLAEVEGQDLMGQIVEDLFSPTARRRFLLVIGAMVLLLVAWRAWLRARRPSAEPVPRLSAALERSYRRGVPRGDAGPSADLFRPGSSMGRKLARDILAHLQGQPEPSPDLSRIRVSAGWRQRRRIRQHLVELRRIAFAPESEATQTDDWRTLTQCVEFLSEWVDCGLIAVPPKA